MAKKEHIPQTFRELTPQWLTATLREQGLLRDESVRSVEIEILGEGEGFVGEVARLTLEYDAPVEGMPSSLIAKLPTPVGQNRKMGELLGAYEREILFYEKFAGNVPLRMPRFFAAVMDRTSGGMDDAEGAAKLDNAPMWFIGAFMPVVTAIIGRRRRRYILLIEDFASGRTGDQVSGCSPEEAAPVVRGIARLHAAHWRDETLTEHTFLRRHDLNPRTMQSIYKKHVKAFHRRYGSGMGDELRRALAWLDEHGDKSFRGYEAPETLIHCDLRLDNVFFFPDDADASRDEERAAVFDWQLAGRGPGPYDLAYFLSSALPAATDDDTVRELVKIYAEELAASGVEGYDLETCTRDYHRGLLNVLHRVASTDAMDMGEDRGSDLVWLWAERAVSRLRGVEFSALY